MATLNIIKASAGSGKTYKLAYSFIKRLLTSPELFHEILAVTFTNKATCQMKDRILSNLQKLKEKPESESYIEQLRLETGYSLDEIKKKASEAQLKILADYNRFAISTIDKFFTRIVRSFFNELHKDPSYEVVVSTNELLDQAILDIILDENHNKILEPIFNKRINSEKNYDIRSDISKVKGLILKHDTFDFDYDLLRKVYDNDRNRLDQLKNNIISLANSILQIMMPVGITESDYYRGSAGFAGNLKKIADGITFEIKKGMTSAIEEGKLCSSKCSKIDYIESIRQRLINDLAVLKDKCMEYTKEANTTELIENNIDYIQIIKIIQEKYKENCKRDHLVAINEMPKIVSDIANNELLSFLYMKIDARLKSIMIDEFQDTSTEQWEGFRPIFEEICSSQNTENLIIGDIKQAIYRWRGGNEALLREEVPMQFYNYLHEDKLEVNYRSDENIIKFNNLLFEKIKANGIDSDDIKFEGKEDIRKRINDLIQRTYSDSEQKVYKKNESGYVECMFIDNDGLVAKIVADKIKNEIIPDGFSKKDIAVVVRNNNDASDIAEIFSKESIDFISGESLILDNSRIVHLINTLLYLALNPKDKIKIADYNLCIGCEMTSPLSDDLLKQLKQVSSEPIVEATAIILQEIIKEDTSSETAFLDAYLDIVYQKQVKESMSMREFVKWWEENKDSSMLSSPEGQDAVTIITIHKSKGLEYPVVIAPRVNWSLIKYNEMKYFTADKETKYSEFRNLPVSFSKKCYNSEFKGEYLNEIEQQIIDNINLLYVLVTRAGNRLYMMFPKTKTTSIRIVIQEALNKFNNLSKDENGVISFGKKNNSIKKDNQSDTTEIIESINPIKFERPFSKSSTFIESGNNTSNIIQGILMHDVLSRIERIDDLEKLVREKCEIEAEDYNQYIHVINKIKARAEIKEWFSDKWKHYTERGIMIPDMKSNKRPDRVLVNGNRAIVIDYKFGMKKFDKYTDQVREYMNLVSQLGYTQILGYIYYVTLDEVEEIE